MIVRLPTTVAVLMSVSRSYRKALFLQLSYMLSPFSSTPLYVDRKDVSSRLFVKVFLLRKNTKTPPAYVPAKKVYRTQIRPYVLLHVLRF